MISSDGLLNQRACHRRMIMFLITPVIQVLDHLFDARRYHYHAAIVAINGMGQERFLRHLYRYLGILIIIGRPRLVTRTIVQYRGIMRQLLDHVFHRCNVRHLIFQVDGRRQFSIHVIRPCVLRTILLLIATHGLVLLSRPIRMIKRMDSCRRSVLHLAIRNLNVGVMAQFIILRRPTLFLRRPRVHCHLIMRAQIILVHALQGIGLQLSSIVREFLITFHLFTNLDQIWRIMETKDCLLRRILQQAGALREFGCYRGT